MKRFVLAVAVFPLFSVAAYAADLPNTKGPAVFAPPPPPVFTWTGLYVGAQVGYQWGETSYNATAAGVFTPEPTFDSSGVVGGGHVGYNYQVSQFVVGIEGDLEGSSYNGSGLISTGSGITSERIPIDGSIRARVGIAWDRVLIYLTGGGSFASIRDSLVSITPLIPYANTSDFGRVGWTAGGGIEYAIDPNWSVRAEYRFTDYGNYDYGLPAGPGVPAGTTLHLLQYDNRVEAGFSYKFDVFAPPAPVVAKY